MNEAKYFYRNGNAPKPNKPNHIGTCAFIFDNDKLLLEKRSDNNCWGLIGGGLEIYESLEQCILREIYEETGISLKENDLQFFKVYSDPSRIAEYPDGNILRIITVVYIVQLRDRFNLKLSKESLELKYFNYNELGQLNIVATHKHIINDYEESKLQKISEDVNVCDIVAKDN